MSKKANKTVIGIFVVGAIALVLGALLILGSGKFFKEREIYVMVFEGSVKGLNVGAPVVFRGVRIGSVSEIAMHFDPTDMSFTIPVYIQTGEANLRAANVDAVVLRETGKESRRMIFQELINRGLRAQLENQNIVTGQLQIGLDFYPDKPGKIVGIDPRYVEIPTIPTTFQEVFKKLQELPLEELFQKILSSVEGIEKVVQSPELSESVSNLNQVLKDIQKLVRNVDNRIEPIASSIEGTVNDYGALARNADGKIEPLTAGANEAFRAITVAAKRADKTLLALEGIVSEDAVVTTELTKTLKELSTAARSIRIWADYLERHPEALIRGKGEYRR